MGSKRYMLRNGLGEMIIEQARDHERVVDLFTGSASVAWFAAEHIEKPVLAIDLQGYAVALAHAVLCRTQAVCPTTLGDEWIHLARKARNRSSRWKRAVELTEQNDKSKLFVTESRALCASLSTVGPVWNAYGGHYFSAKQAITLDYLLKYLPGDDLNRGVCLAVLISVASECAAAPGHTAQPFQPTDTALIHLMDAWNRDPIALAKQELEKIAPIHAQVRGEARVGDAVVVARELSDSDLVIIDPPYSAVHYSRFYHVLETIARGRSTKVSGVGRYPAPSERPKSDFSLKGRVTTAFEDLFSALASSGSTVILTYPAGDCSTGISGDDVIAIADKVFTVEEKKVTGTFSTMGGRVGERGARNQSNELLLLMKPK